MKRRATLRIALLALIPLCVLPLYGQTSCNRNCPPTPNPCERSVGRDSSTGLCRYDPADGAPCNYSAEGDGICRNRKCESAECQGVDFFQGCDAPLSGGFEGACISDFCASVVPIDECVKEGIGRINCCSQWGCANGQSPLGCAQTMDGMPCDPSNLEAPGIDGQKGHCVGAVCVPNPGEACEEVFCAPSANPCKRNDLLLSDPECPCQEWAVDGRPPCPYT
ncbi:MAG: hypothetical protein AMJ62_08965 [Myxococcales bacterium SG8_38]|nr:MAG: hypothetical protein AMJ62_08965 [Myxococcales bacterium SG8_38]